MKRIKVISISVLILLLLLGAVVYIDYYIVKNKNTIPKISIKSETKEFYVYKALFYKVWKCKSDNSIIIGGYDDPDALCKINYEFKDGYYINSNGVEISKKDLSMLTITGVYTSDMIENMETKSDVELSLYVVSKYEMLDYKKVNELKSNDGYDIIVFPTFEYNSETDTYNWNYNTSDTDKYYCFDSNKKMYSKYRNSECGEFVSLTLDDKWCNAYKNSTLIYNKEISKYCVE